MGGSGSLSVALAHYASLQVARLALGSLGYWDISTVKNEKTGICDCFKKQKTCRLVNGEI